MRDKFFQLLAMLMVFALSLGTQPAAAQDVIRELKGGVLWHDVPNLWSGFSLETDSPIDLNAEVIFSPVIPFFYGGIRPAVGATFNTGHGTSHAYLDARWEYEASTGLYLATGVGAAIHNGDISPDHIDKKALGSRVLFHFPLELGWRWDGHNSVSAYFEHTSDGNLVRYNEGMDRLGIRYGYRF